eukprot:10954044-Lingulodinium_polyedra.AAC.1
MAAWLALRGGGNPNRSAAELAWELAVELEAAEAAGEAIVGVALDWRKAFDHIPLASIGPALQRAGVPDWVAGPCVSAYHADRRLRVEGVLGG